MLRFVFKTICKFENNWSSWKSKSGNLQKKRYASVPIDFLQRDASKFSDFPNGYFDVIVDKVIARNTSSLIEILYIKHSMHFKPHYNDNAVFGGVQDEKDESS